MALGLIHKILNPNLCPTHKCEMEYATYSSTKIGVVYRICLECKSELYNRITKMKLTALKLRRNNYLRKFPDKAELFEGL